MGGVWTSIFLAIFIFASTVGVFAHNTGDTVRYTSARNDGDAMVFTISGARGVCGQAGVAALSSGTATVTRLDKDHIARKVAYVYGREWIDKDGRNYDMGGLKYGMLTEALIQFAIQGQTALDVHSSDWSQDTLNAIKDTVDGLKNRSAASLGIPNSFVAYYCNAGAGQNFVAWGTVETGKVKLKKSSNNPSITG